MRSMVEGAYRADVACVQTGGPLRQSLRDCHLPVPGRI
jgi:hypothetical protein